MPAAFEGEPLEIGFNPEFLREGIESVEGDEVVLRLISPLRPGPAAAGRQRRLPLPGDADSPQRVRRCGRCWSPQSRPRPLRSLERLRLELGRRDRQPDRAQRRRQDELARGALLRPHRPLVPHRRPPRPDPLRRLAGARRGAWSAARTASSGRCWRRSAAPRAAATCSTATRPTRRRSPATARRSRVFSPDRLALVKGPPARAPRPPRRLRRRPLARRARSCAGATARRWPSATRCSPGSPPAPAARPSSTPGTRRWPRPRRR